MRDGVHKSLPMGRVWRRLMRQSGCAADRGPRTRDTALEAMASDVRKELSPKLVSRLVVALDPAAPALFNPLIGYSCPSELGGAPSPMNGRLLECCQMLVEHGMGGNEAVSEALRIVLTERRDASLRAMHGHWLREGGFGTGPAMQDCAAALRAVDLGAMADRIVGGQTPCEPHQRHRQHIDLDGEDLGA